jgi:hypothetical protein
MYTLVFESQVDLLTPSLSFMFILLVTIFLYNNIVTLNNTVQNRIIKIVYKVFSLAILSIFALNIYDNYKVKQVFKYSSYQVEEGKIYNFKPMPKSGHGQESFEVNGKYFSIGYTGNYPKTKTLFYTLTKNRNGPIKKNGQKVKIFYIDILGKNKIIKMWIEKP